MKCPKCGGGVKASHERDFGFVHRCNCCGKEWNSRRPIDPAELLRLIEAVDTIEAGAFPFLYAVAARNLIDAIKSYLSGDHKPLEELAGE